MENSSGSGSVGWYRRIWGYEDEQKGLQKEDMRYREAKLKNFRKLAGGRGGVISAQIRVGTSPELTGWEWSNLRTGLGKCVPNGGKGSTGDHSGTIINCTNISNSSENKIFIRDGSGGVSNSRRFCKSALDGTVHSVECDAFVERPFEAISFLKVTLGIENIPGEA
jgi:hypothetical protein